MPFRGQSAQSSSRKHAANSQFDVPPQVSEAPHSRLPDPSLFLALRSLAHGDVGHWPLYGN